MQQEQVFKFENSQSYKFTNMSKQDKIKKVMCEFKDGKLKT